ncbi:MAG: hypothetical protein GY845_36825 [Planctomycetes bacterium]|nr:hypothetical protein [Planctomycetota bacterium]
MGNVILAIFLMIVAVVLLLARSRGWIKRPTLGRWDKIAGVMSFLLGLIMLVLPSVNDLLTTSGSFNYQVRIVAQGTGNDVAGANVRIEVDGGIPPFRSVTGADGLARFSIESSYIEEPGRLVVDATGYKQYELLIELRENELPLIIQIEPES